MNSVILSIKRRAQWKVLHVNNSNVSVVSQLFVFYSTSFYVALSFNASHFKSILGCSPSKVAHSHPHSGPHPVHREEFVTPFRGKVAAHCSVGVKRALLHLNALELILPVEPEGAKLSLIPCFYGGRLTITLAMREIARKTKTRVGNRKLEVIGASLERFSPFLRLQQ